MGGSAKVDARRRADVVALGGTNALRAPTASPQRVLSSRRARRDYTLRRLLLCADLAALLAALSIALIWTGGGSMAERLLWGAGTIPVWVVLFKLYGLYERDTKRVSHTTIDDLPWLFHAIAIGSIATWLYFDSIAPDRLSFRQVLVFAVLALGLVVSLRSLMRRMSDSVVGRERVLLVGQGPATSVLLRKMHDHPEYGLDPVGLVDDPPIEHSAEPGRAPQPADGAPRALGSLADLGRIIALHRIDRIVLTPDSLDEAQLATALRVSRTASIKVSLLPQLFDVLGPSVEIDSVEGVTVLGVNPPILGSSSWVLKRTLDVAGALAILTLILPALAVVALAIKLTSRGPVLFRQDRIGRDGRAFRLVKFRTMVADAERQAADLMAQSRDPRWLHLDHDPRVTQLGRLLRATSLDELPQLWNVLKGEMSLVGPRPLPVPEDANVHGWRRARLDLTPGITGYWQVLGRTRIPFEEMVKLDYLYVTNWSLWGDIRLILHTLPAVLGRRGVN